MIIRKSSWAALPLLFVLSACGGGGGGGSTGAEAESVDTTPQNSANLPEVSWYSAAKPLMDRYCVACHSEGSTLAPFPLETYSEVRSKRSALIYVFESGTMPPQGYSGPNPDENQLLLDWLNDGAPEGDVSQQPVPLLTPGLTYHADTRAILEEKCVTCHEEGGVAPFPLDTYESVKAVSSAAAFAVDNDSMPPWHPTRGYTAFTDSRALTPPQKHTLSSWLQGGMVEGDPRDYQAPTTKEQKSLDDYDLRLKLPQAYTPTLRPDDHRCFAIEWPLEEYAYVTSVDVIPDQIEEVHHVIVSILAPKDAALAFAADGEDGNPGWYCLGMGGVDGASLPRQIGGWVPGAGREPLPEGTGIGIEPGSVMIVQMHYNTLVAEPTPDQSTILVETASEVDRPASSFLVANPAWLGKGGMPIPANDPDVHHEFTLPTNILGVIAGRPIQLKITDPWVLHQTLLHMHTRGESGRVTLIRKNGSEQVLLDIREWDFNWQSTYRFERELLIEPGDRLKLECNWDNSKENQDIVDGVQLESQHIEWGDGTGDEMCLFSVLMTRPGEDYNYSYAPTVHIETPGYRQQFSAGDLVPLKLLLNNFTLHDPGEHDHTDPDNHMGSDHMAETDDHSQVFAGHYHVYLDTDDDDADHLTAWDDNYYYQLPEETEPGLHTLRVSLRGADHHALDIEQQVEIEVVDSPVTTKLRLVDIDAWAEQGAADDSLSDHRPTEIQCPANSWYDEDGALEVETGYCNYLSLAQPSLEALSSGDTLHLVLWHGDLAFEQPAVAHVAVSVGGKILWEEEVDIPTQANIYDLRIPVDFDAPVGSVVEYHLHNHGYNSWTLLELEVEH